MRKNSGIFAGLLAGTMMTPAERAAGRFLRAPDGHPQGSGDAEFDAFNEGGAVEVGESQKDQPDPDAEAKPEKKPRRAPKPAAEAKPEEKPDGAADDDDGEKPEGEADDEADDDEEDEEEKPVKPRKKASERIRELTRRNGQQGRLIEQLSSRLDAIEKGGLPAGQKGGNQADAIGEAPNPTDTEKYPLGHLDDRYIEDKLEWLAEKKAAGQADAVLQREQEAEQTRRATEAHTELLGKVDTLTERGSEIYDDFQEAVVDGGLKGEWPLQQPTFEAAYDADHGAQILYELSQDTKLAKEVAAKSPYQQLKWVVERDAEISKTKQPKRIPGAGEPPKTVTRGANSRTEIRPDTDNLDDFEKAWKRDEQRKS